MAIATPAWRLIAWDEEGSGRDKVRIALNPRLGSAAKGAPPYTLIDMREARQLDGDLARLLHQRLCARINVGDEGAARIETLLGYPAWGSNEKASTLAQRRTRLNLALDELRSIGWSIEEKSRGLFSIERPSSNAEGSLPVETPSHALPRVTTPSELAPTILG